MGMKFKPCLLLQKRARENECGIPGNPLKISWLDGFSSSTDANSETISEHSNPTRSCSDGAAVDSKVALWSKIFYWGIKWNSTYLLIFLGLLTCVFSALVHLIFVTDHKDKKLYLILFFVLLSASRAIIFIRQYHLWQRLWKCCVDETSPVWGKKTTN